MICDHPHTARICKAFASAKARLGWNWPAGNRFTSQPAPETDPDQWFRDFELPRFDEFSRPLLSADVAMIAAF
jgi:hypothetical protein